MHNRILITLAVFCQFLALFPFAVLTEGVGFGGYVWWHYAAIYAAAALFYGCGRFLGAWASRGGFSRRTKPIAVFLARVGFFVPSAAFIVVCAVFHFHTGLYLYLLPACIAAYFGGYLSVGKEYSDVFTRGWFAVYFVAAILSAILLNCTGNKQLVSDGMMQLCVAFGILIVLAAVLTNQTNIDVQTRQRAGGHALVPKGTRRYNAYLIAAVGAAVVGLFLLSGPIASLLFKGIQALLRWLLSLVRAGVQEDPQDGEMAENTADAVEYDMTENPIADLLMFLFEVFIVILIIKFRRQIWGFFKEIFAPLFKVPVREEAVPFVDELSESSDEKTASRELRRSEREIYRRYRRETDPVMKYREGYELFLIKLGASPFPQLNTDTTTIHSAKGEKAFGRHIPEAELDGMVQVYNRVRYGGEVPDERELLELDRIIEAIIRNDK